MKPIVEMTQLELEDTLLKYEVLKKENHANGWTAILEFIVIFGLLFWISELMYQRDYETLEKLKYKAIAEKQTEYFSTQLDTMVFYNDCGVRIELDK